jgi:hypothetical protein
MTPDDLRVITISLNEKRGTGGQIKPARHRPSPRLAQLDALAQAPRLSKITRSDELAIRQAVAYLKASSGQVPCQA